MNPTSKRDKLTTKDLNLGKYKIENTFKNALATMALDNITFNNEIVRILPKTNLTINKRSKSNGYN